MYIITEKQNETLVHTFVLSSFLFHMINDNSSKNQHSFANVYILFMHKLITASFWKYQSSVMIVFLSAQCLGVLPHNAAFLRSSHSHLSFLSNDSPFLGIIVCWLGNYHCHRGNLDNGYRSGKPLNRVEIV